MFNVGVFKSIAKVSSFTIDAEPVRIPVYLRGPTPSATNP